LMSIRLCGVEVLKLMISYRERSLGRLPSIFALMTLCYTLHATLSTSISTIFKRLAGLLQEVTVSHVNSCLLHNQRCDFPSRMKKGASRLPIDICTMQVRKLRPPLSVEGALPRLRLVVWVDDEAVSPVTAV